MGAKGAAASAEAADVVLLVDSTRPRAAGDQIARRVALYRFAKRHRRYGAVFHRHDRGGAGLHHAGRGALLQEVIDVAVIFNALRALRG